jgi:iron complex outermembrane receptor protein
MKIIRFFNQFPGNCFRYVPGVAIISASLAVQTLPAQDAGRENEEVFELSPFVVDASTEQGYVATQTLAGTRISSSIRDIGAQVDVMTAEFLADIGATNIEDAQLYSLNVENAEEFAPGIQSRGGSGGDASAGTLDLNSVARVRGISNATKTRDYFPTLFQLDTYNSDRFTYNSGPNAILFGLGSPGGVINTDIRRAYFNDQGRFRVQVDTENSTRADLMINKVIFEDKLAIVVAGLKEDRESWQKPSFDRKERYYGSFTYKPFKGTTIRGSYENIDRETNWPRWTAIRDGVTPYLAYREAMMKQLGITDLYDPRLYWAPGDPSGDTSPFERASGSNLRLITGSYAPIPDYLKLGEYWRGGSTRAITGTTDTTYLSQGVTPREPRRIAGVRPEDDVTVSLPEGLFPADINLGGATLVKAKGDIWSAFIEQRIGKNFFLEMAASVEDRQEEVDDWIRGAGQTLRMDVNRYLPQKRLPDGSYEEPVLNPNRGRFFIEDWGRGSYADARSENARATATYAVDFTRHDGWKAWLGKHNFSLMADYYKNESLYQNFRTGLFPPFADGIVLAGNGSNTNHYRVMHRVYLDDPADPAGSVFTFDPKQHTTFLYGAPFASYDPVYVAMRPEPELGYGVWAAAEGIAEETKGRMIAIQSRFLNDRLVLTYGRRSDDYRQKEIRSGKAVDSPHPWDQRSEDVSQIRPPSLEEPDISESGVNESKGVVLHALSWLSVFYNESSNQDVGSPGLNLVTGELHPPSTGEGRDYGFTLDLMEGKFSAKINWFEVSQLRVESVQFTGFRWDLRQVENKFLGWSQDSSVPVPDEGPYIPATTWDPESTTDTNRADVLADIVSEGMEFTITYNPNRNWRFRFTATKTESVEDNIGDFYREFIDMRRPEWQKYYNATEVLGDGSVITGPRAWQGGGVAEPGEETVQPYVENLIFTQNLEIMKAYEGRLADRVSKWRVNLVGTYQFREGLLEGLNIGLGFRWRDARSIGYPITTVNGIEILDVDNPWFGKPEKNLDGWISYRMKLFNNKVNARFQLNVTNILGDETVLPQTALTSGETAQYRYQTPRLFRLTTTFEF